MKVTVQQPKLAKALSYVARAVSSKPNIPVLSNVLLVVHEDHLQLAATNLDMGINMWIPGVVGADGKVTASGKLLTDFIAAAGGDKVDIELKRDVLQVTTDSAKAQFQTIAASEFPILPSIEGDSYFSIKTSDFLDAMDRVVFACATDVTTSKIQLTGVMFELGEAPLDAVTFVGLNGYRLSRKVATIARQQGEAAQLIVPARPLQELVRIASAEEAENMEVFISKNKSQLIFKLDEIEFSIRLLEGPYPNYETAIPAEHVYAFEVDKDAFEQALKVVNTFARNTLGSKVNWDLDIESSTLLMHSEVTDLGRNEVRLPVQAIEGTNDLKDAYSLQYLMEMAHHTPGKTIRFETQAPLLPAVFTDKKDKHYVHIVMPMERDD